jgi:hypothetical protein
VIPIFFYQNECGLYEKCSVGKFTASDQNRKFFFYIRSNIKYNDTDLLDVPLTHFNKIYSEILQQDGSLMMSHCDYKIWGEIYLSE